MKYRSFQKVLAVLIFYGVTATPAYSYPFIKEVPLDLRVSVIPAELRDDDGRPYMNLCIQYSGHIVAGDTMKEGQFVESRFLKQESVYPTILVHNKSQNPEVISRPNRFFYNKRNVSVSRWKELTDSLVFIEYMAVGFDDQTLISTYEGDTLMVYVMLGPVTTYHDFLPVYPNVLGPVTSIDYFWDDLPPLSPEDFFDQHSTICRVAEIVIPVHVVPPESRILFERFVRPNGQQVDNWLPVYGDTIGIAMTHENPASMGTFRYHIWDVSTWQGICMNYPINAPKPVSVQGSSADFDFEIINSDRYNIATYNYDELCFTTKCEKEWAKSRFRVTLDTSATYSFRGWNLVQKNPSVRDTLWLRIKDYGAKCLVSPRVGSKTKYRMNPQTDALQREVFTLSLPPDLDGYYDYGVNYGDGMADAWEALYAANDSTALYDILPFTHWTDKIEHPVPPTDHGSADQDSIGQGRRWEGVQLGNQLYGDMLCNFTEYRGFVICGDDSTLFGPEESQHVRTNPKKKTVFGWISPLIPDTLRELYPGYIYALRDSLEVFFVEKIGGEGKVGFLTSPRWRDTTEGRSTATNVQNCSRFYYGFPLITRRPILENVHAVSFWQDDSLYQRWRVGGNYPSGGNTSSLSYEDVVSGDKRVKWPNGVCFITVDNINFSLLDTTLDSTGLTYYRQHPEMILPTVRGYYKGVIAHEFGHAVGLADHQPDSTIMSGSTYWYRIDPLNRRTTRLGIPTSFTPKDFARLGIRFPLNENRKRPPNVIH